VDYQHECLAQNPGKITKADSVLFSTLFLEKMMKKALFALLFLLSGGVANAETAGGGTPSPEPAQAQDAPVASAPARMAAPQTANRVVIVTTRGDITLELFPEKSPKTVENFLQYVEDGFYEGTIFHRVINNFMIQGGGYDKEYNKRETRDPVPNEADNGLGNKRGTIAMARTMDPHSATAQFFINHKDNPALDHRNKGAGWGYAVFGQVVDGMDVVDAIATTKTGPGGPFRKDAPQEMVVIERITLLTD
jgi:cyclophilin family peptidyl-prolyl cis-trans isomerase